MKNAILAATLVFAAANSGATDLPLYDQEPYCFDGKVYLVPTINNETILSLMPLKDADGFTYDCRFNKYGSMIIERSVTTFEAQDITYGR